LPDGAFTPKPVSERGRPTLPKIGESDDIELPGAHDDVRVIGHQASGEEFYPSRSALLKHCTP
jgi:hypothetical protein